MTETDCDHEPGEILFSDVDQGGEIEVQTNCLYCDAVLTYGALWDNYLIEVHNP